MTPAHVLRPRSVLLIAGTAVLLSVLATAPAFAQGKDPVGENADQIVLTGRLVVTADETVDAAVIFNGPALVE